MSENDVVVEVPVWMLLRNILYPDTPTLSVEALHERLICVLETAGAVRFAGTDGAVVSSTEPSEYSDGRSLPTGGGLCPPPLLSRLSAGGSFTVRPGTPDT